MDLVDLVIAARAGDRAAFSAVVRRFQDMAFAGAYAWLGDVDESQDAAQEAFLDAWQCLGNLRDPAAFPGWFRRIVIKHADRIARARQPVLPAFVLEIPAPTPDPAAALETVELRDSVRAAVARLPENQRLALTLHHLDGYSQKEVAAFLELPVSTVKKRIFDARRALQERMVTMVKETLDKARPSRDEGFARRVDFFVALKAGDIDSMARLLSEDVDLMEAEADWEAAPEIRSASGSITALRWSVGHGNLPMLDLLLRHGGEEIVERHGRSLLHWGLLGDWLDIVRRMLDLGVDVNCNGGCSQTPLHRAAMRDSREFVDLFLEAGAEIDARDHRDRTPADWAMLKGHIEMARYLVSRVQPNRLGNTSRSASKRPSGQTGKYLLARACWGG